MSLQEASPFALRLAALTLELIERRKVSLETAYIEALHRVGRGEPYALRLARKALLRFAKADLLLKVHGLENTPLRRKNAFRVAYAMIEDGYDAKKLGVGLLSRRLRELLTREKLEEDYVSRLQPVERIAVENSFPSWIINEVSKRLGLNEAERLVKACAKRTIWVRVNELKISRSKAIEAIRRIVNVREDEHFPELLELVGVEEVPPGVMKMVERGHVTIQDRGSVAVVHALGEAKHLLVMDAAAAPGMKTSLLQQLSGNEAEIVAVDVSRRRLSEMRKVLSKLNVRNVHLVLSDSRILKSARKFDRVLLDAPCTNTGAIPSDPALRLALWTPDDIEKFSSLQRSILSNTIKHLKEGGELVYSTCSLLSSEGESIIDDLPFDWLSEEGLWGSPGYRGFTCSSRVRRLYPHIHRTIGFFVAKVAL